MRNSRRLAATSLSIISISTIFAPAGSAEISASGTRPASEFASSRVMQDISQATLELQNPMNWSDLYMLTKKASPQAPLEVNFQNGNWSGGVILTGDSETARQVIKHFRDSQASQGEESLKSISGSKEAIFNGPMSQYRGTRTLGGQKQTLEHTETKGVPLAVRTTDGCTNCTVTLNDTGDDPSVPSSGSLKQWRYGGVDSMVEVTQHSFTGLGKGYPASLKIENTGLEGSVKPKYIYEHDYKVKNNGYVGTSDSYSWSSDLPGAYRDTRAAGLGDFDNNAGMLDFTVGSVYTWKLNPSKTYHIETSLGDNLKAGKVRSSEAALTASVIPNDGAMSRPQALFNDGCTFNVDTLYYPLVPIDVYKKPAGDLAWCGGIGDIIHPAYVKNISLIKKPTFAIKAGGTCYKWKTGSSYTAC